jgi:hypothetical protein
MYLVLLVFGAILTVAGIVLAATGLSLHDNAFDMSVVTPGVVAAVGGLALIGLGLALRVLERIERSLSARPMRRVSRPGETDEPVLTAERPGETARISFPRTAQRSRPAFGAAAAAAEKESDDLPEMAPPRFAEKTPALSRIEDTTIIEAMEVALAPKSSSSVDEAVGQMDKLRAARRKNGGAPARIAPQLDLGARSPLTSDRPRGPAFETLWPKGARPMRATQSAPAVAAIEEPVAPPEPEIEQPPELVQETAPETAEVTVLKSGVVDGMAYTLYSDGSIEADLPQGTLRFGSITELRNHIEQSA